MHRFLLIIFFSLLHGCIDEELSDDYSYEAELTEKTPITPEADSTPVHINGTTFNPPPRPDSQLVKNFGGRQKRFAPMINRISRQYGIDPALTHAIISQESVYKPAAGSSAGAVGLMQLIPEAGERFGCVNRTNPQCNVNAGVQYLKFLANMFSGQGNLQTIAAGYNAGEGAAMSYLKGTKLKGKNPLGRKTPNGVPVASFSLSQKQKASCRGNINHNPIPRCEGQTYHYARNVAGYYLRYKRNPSSIGIGNIYTQTSRQRPSSRAAARGRT